ncbi:uncharacterized protein ACRADG_000333 [Cochliomyia hominivorax]
MSSASRHLEVHRTPVEAPSASNKTPLTRQQQQQQQQPHQSPLTPVIAVRTPEVISILQFNCNGLQGKVYIGLVLGDFNAHHQLWHSRLGDDQRGTLLAEQIDESTFCTLNDDAPTRIMGTCASSPDIKLASASLINCTTWQTVVSLGSDHLPIIVSLERPNDFIVSERRTYMNQKKADWRGFREFTDHRFGELPVPSNVRIAERKFRETINTAVARFVPSGRISVVRPHFPAEAARLADERDDTRNTNPSDPRIAQLNSGISRLVNVDKRNKWLDHLSKCNLNTGVLSDLSLIPRRRMIGLRLSLQIKPFPTLRIAREHFADNLLSIRREIRRKEVLFANFTTFQSWTHHHYLHLLKLQRPSTQPNHLKRLAPTVYRC